MAFFQVHLGVGGGAEGHVLDAHLDLEHLPLLELDLLRPVEDLVPDRARHAVSGHDDHVLQVRKKRLSIWRLFLS